MIYILFPDVFRLVKIPSLLKNRNGTGRLCFPLDIAGVSKPLPDLSPGFDHFLSSNDSSNLLFVCPDVYLSICRRSSFFLYYLPDLSLQKLEINSGGPLKGVLILHILQCGGPIMGGNDPTLLQCGGPIMAVLTQPSYSTADQSWWYCPNLSYSTADQSWWYCPNPSYSTADQSWRYCPNPSYRSIHGFSTVTFRSFGWFHHYSSMHTIYREDHISGPSTGSDTLNYRFWYSSTGPDIQGNTLFYILWSLHNNCSILQNVCLCVETFKIFFYSALFVKHPVHIYFLQCLIHETPCTYIFFV